MRWKIAKRDDDRCGVGRRSYCPREFLRSNQFYPFTGTLYLEKVEEEGSKRARIRNYEGGTCPTLVPRLLSACWWLFLNGAISLGRRKSYSSAVKRFIRHFDFYFTLKKKKESAVRINFREIKGDKSKRSRARIKRRPLDPIEFSRLISSRVHLRS